MLLYWMLLGYIFNREIVAYFDSKKPEKTKQPSERYSNISANGQEPELIV
jgi:hypothetical protein